MTVDEFFAGHSDSRSLFAAVAQAVESIGQSEIHVSKSEIAFRRRVNFAFAWMPGVYLHREIAPLVLAIGLRRRDESTRWKSVVEPAPGRFTHHLELYSPDDIDDEVRGWLAEAWRSAA